MCTYTHTVSLYLNSIRNWTVYISCFKWNTNLCSWQKFGSVPPKSWERWASTCTSFDRYVSKASVKVLIWESFKRLHVFHWDPKTLLVLRKTLIGCLVLLQMGVLSNLSSYFQRLDMKYRSVLWQALNNVVRISHHATNTVSIFFSILPCSCISLSCFHMLLLHCKTRWKYRTEGRSFGLGQVKDLSWLFWVHKAFIFFCVCCCCLVFCVFFFPPVWCLVCADVL